MDLEYEIWKDVPDYEGLYRVSNMGRVKSFQKGKEKILKLGVNACGYLHVDLCKNGIKRTTKVNRLVYETFNGKTDLQVDHIVEGNKKDNRLSNLQAITSRENNTKHRLTLNKSSQYVGVHWFKQTKKWVAYIRINGKRKHLGFFVNEIDAHNKYQEALKEIKNT